MRRAIVIAAATVALMPGAAAFGQNALRYGDWRVDIGKTYVDVFAANRSGSKIGWGCSRDTERCVYYLLTDNSCNPDGPGVPALISSNKGAATADLECKIFGRGFVLVFRDYELIEGILLNGGEVGVAYPMVGGAFQVSRFNTDQFKNAKEAANRIHNSTGYRGPRDTRL